MQFTVNQKVGNDYFHVTLDGHLSAKVLQSMFAVFEKIGGSNPSECWDIWKFPSYITSQTIAQIIHNTCFVCGGIMSDGQALEIPKASQPIMKQVRKCSSCGHSHT